MKRLLLAALCAATLVLCVPVSSNAQTTGNTSPGVTVNTTAPVTSDTKISVGTLAGEVLTWMAAAFSAPVGLVLTAWLVRLFKKAGVEVTQQMSDQLDRTLVNGLNDAAAKAAALSKDKGVLTSSNQIVAAAVSYAQDHRAETIQALGLDPQSGKTVEALKARIATLVADPTVPTPPVLNTTPKPVA